jgi:hypothetical protein
VVVAVAVRGRFRNDDRPQLDEAERPDRHRRKQASPAIQSLALAHASPRDAGRLFASLSVVQSIALQVVAVAVRGRFRNDDRPQLDEAERPDRHRRKQARVDTSATPNLRFDKSSSTTTTTTTTPAMMATEDLVRD